MDLQKISPTPDKNPATSGTVWGALGLLIPVIAGILDQLNGGQSPKEIVTWLLSGQGAALLLAFFGAVMGLGVRRAVGAAKVEQRQQVAPPPK